MLRTAPFSGFRRFARPERRTPLRQLPAAPTLATFLALFIGLAVSLTAPAAAQEEAGAPLAEEHRVWLEEEVVWIITETEREVFVGLSSFEEREYFIEAFWQRRDPIPATAENEFRIEHYERFDYANRYLGRDAPRPGWRTDRGKYWIILGEPRTREAFDGLNEVVSAELWIYQGDTRLGLPPRFNLLFFKKEDIGEYELYHPMADGPDALVRRGELLRNRQNQAVDILETVSMDLARASLVVDLTDPSADFLRATNTIAPVLDTVRPSMSADRNIVDISESAQKRVDLDELEGFLRYGDRVSAEYSFRFVRSEADFSVFFGPRNTPFLNYTVKLAPEDFSLEQDEDAAEYVTTLDIELELRHPEGPLLAMHRNSPMIRLSESEHRSASGQPFAYRDNLPVLPGDYEVSVVLRNRATSQYTVVSQPLTVPASGGGHPALADLMLAYRSETGSQFEGAPRFGTYQFGATVFEPALGGSFADSDTLSVVPQSVNAGPGFTTRIRILSDELDDAAPRLMDERVVEPGRPMEPPVEDFLLGELGAGRYRIVADLLDAAGEVAASRDARLTVSPRSDLARAGFIIRRSFATHVPGLLALALGEQFLAHGRVDDAVIAFREAAANPDLPMARWKLASALLFTRQADEALDLLLPIEADHPNEVEVAEGVGFAYYIRQECREALPRLEHAMTLRAPDPSLLNALGDCHQQGGDGDRARELFRRSLEMNPTQEGVRARLAELGDPQDGQR